jgi:predicted metalloprotease with PDZ domain
VEDAEARLAEVSGDAAFARDFFARYVEGREVADYARLLRRAGLVVKRDANRAWWGDLSFEWRATQARVASLVAPSWPAYGAGIEQDDTIVQLGGSRVASSSDIDAALRRHRPGDKVMVVFVDRAGVTKRGLVTLAADPHVEVLPIEAADGALTAADRAFRERWLASLQ